ncbi:MAG: hypothetical protein IPK62_17355 [Bacteroidetes bacterium]|nr:hypothetical protein [Bacteroidota bacterium]
MATVIGNNTITSAKILDGTILGTDLNSAINVSTSGSVTAATFSGNGGSLVGLTAANITVGSLTDAQINNDITLNSTAPITGTAGLSITSGGANISGGLVVSGGNITGNLIGSISGTSSGFTGLLAGDVIGTQGATVVSTVGGQTSANISLGVAAANNATNTNTPGRIVIRDASGNFVANTVSANLTGNVTGNLTGNVLGNVTGDLTGNASNALALGGNGPAFYQDAGNQTTGFLPDARLTANIPRLGAGSNTFTGNLTAQQLFGQNVGLTNGDLTLGTTGPNAAFLQLPDQVASDDSIRTPANGALRYNSGTGAIELWSGGAWIPGATYSAGTGLTLAGTTFNVSALGITTGLLANDAVTSGKILDGTITGADLAGGITISTSSSITAASFSGDGAALTNLTGGNVNGAVALATNATNATTAVSFSGPLAGDVTGTQGATVIGNNAVNSAKILDGSIVGADLAGNISISTTGTVLASAFSGNGGSLTGLNAASITVGSLNDGQIDNNITLNSNTLITGSAGLNISSGGASIAGGLVVSGGSITGNLIGNVTGNVTGNTSGTAAGFTGSLAGDVTGLQGGTVVSFVGGQTAASIATGANAPTPPQAPAFQTRS